MNKVATSIRLTPKQKEKLEIIANKKERTISEQIRAIINNYLDTMEV